MTRVDGLSWSDQQVTTRAEAGALSTARPRGAALATGSLVLVTLVAVAFSGYLRWSLAHSLTWQRDEIPPLVRFTGLCGWVTNETEAREFRPSLYTFRTGAVRSFHVPTFTSALHTTSYFWTNLTLHLFYRLNN